MLDGIYNKHQEFYKQGINTYDAMDEYLNTFTDEQLTKVLIEIGEGKTRMNRLFKTKEAKVKRLRSFICHGDCFRSIYKGEDNDV